MDDPKASDYVLVLARVYIYFALGALALFFILKTIESRPNLALHVETRGYHVPVEKEPEEVPQPLRKETHLGAS